MSDNDKQLESLHPDLQLRKDLEAGSITQAEIDRVWKATSDLSPQTPITVRRAVLLMREVTQGKEPMEAMALNWPFFTQEVMRTCTEMQAALMRDESKFSHLVAGTETIVKELQKVETLNRQFDHINAQLETIASSLRVLLVRPKPISLIRWQRRRKGRPLTPQEWKEIAQGVDETEQNEPNEAIPDPDHAANEARRFSIGSAWAKEPDKGPMYTWRCPIQSAYGDCATTYLSGVTDPKIIANFRCPTHNVTLVRCRD